MPRDLDRMLIMLPRRQTILNSCLGCRAEILWPCHVVGDLRQWAVWQRVARWLGKYPAIFSSMKWGYICSFLSFQGMYWSVVASIKLWVLKRLQMPRINDSKGPCCFEQWVTNIRLSCLWGARALAHPCPGGATGPLLCCRKHPPTLRLWQNS